MRDHERMRQALRAAHGAGAAGLLALAAALFAALPARAHADTEPSAALAAIEACQVAPDTDDLVARLTEVGFRPITEADADAIFELSTSVALFMVAAGQAGDGTDVAEAEDSADLFAREYDIRVLKAGLAVRSAEQYPQFVGPGERMYVTVLPSTLPPAIPPRHICEVNLPEDPVFARMHADLPGDAFYELPTDWIAQRSDPEASLEGGISLSLRFEPAAFERLYGRTTTARYQFTVNAGPLDEGSGPSR